MAQAESMVRADSQLLTTSEVARLFRVDSKTVRGWAKTGKLTILRTPGGHGRYFKTEVIELLAASSRRDRARPEDVPPATKMDEDIPQALRQQQQP